MNKQPTLPTTVRHELTSTRLILTSIGIALIYLFLALSLQNLSLLSHTLIGNYSLGYKSSLTALIIQGDLLQLPVLEMILLFLTALLVGINIALFLKQIKHLRRNGTLSMTIGGGTLLGLAVTGCSACGFSLLPLLGLGLSFSFLPFGDAFLRVIAVVVLAGSTLYLLKKVHEDVTCNVSPSTRQTESRKR